jgi:hypothetical protein
MCFSAEADFASGVVVGLVGLAALREAETPREWPLAALPLAFAVHQVAEGFVWLGLQGDVSSSTARFALHVYLAYAWVLLPVAVPLAILLVEPSVTRRRIMAAFAVLGAVVGLSLFQTVLTDGVGARIVEHTIHYRGAGDHATLITALYIVATCGTFLASSRPRIVIFGVGNVAAVLILLWLQKDALTSLWCTWAAVISFLIYLELWYQHHGPRTRPASPSLVTRSPADPDGRQPSGSSRDEAAPTER